MEACPICNGLGAVPCFCPGCGQELEEKGPLQEYLDPYSPYLSLELGENLFQTQNCVHLYYCSECRRGFRIGIARQKV